MEYVINPNVIQCISFCELLFVYLPEQVLDAMITGRIFVTQESVLLIQSLCHWIFPKQLRDLQSVACRHVDCILVPICLQTLR